VKVRHYYHVFAGGAWSAPVRDHFTALGRAGLDDMALTVSLVGRDRDRVMARERIVQLCGKWSLPEPEAWIEEEDGWEQVTLSAIHADVRDARLVPGECAVLYMHTKGAYRDTDDNASWRRSMTSKIVPSWEDCVRLLEDHDAVGCHWVRAPEWPEQPPFFAGNFWWSRASYLRTLPPPDTESRWKAETWVSLGNPVIHDMLPEWPAYG
jgi:hypothetical protein